MPARGAYIYCDVGQGWTWPPDPYGWIFYHENTKVVRRVAAVLDVEDNPRGFYQVWAAKQLGDLWITADDWIRWWLEDDQRSGLQGAARRAIEVLQLIQSSSKPATGTQRETDQWIRADEASKHSGLNPDTIRKAAKRERWAILKSGAKNVYRLEDLVNTWPHKRFTPDNGGK